MVKSFTTQEIPYQPDTSLRSIVPQTDVGATKTRVSQPEQTLPLLEKIVQPDIQSGTALLRIFKTLLSIARFKNIASLGTPALGLESDGKFVSRCALPTTLDKHIPGKEVSLSRKNLRYQEFYLNSATELEYMAGAIANKLKELGYAKARQVSYYIDATARIETMMAIFKEVVAKQEKGPVVATLRFDETMSVQDKHKLVNYWQSLSAAYSDKAVYQSPPAGLRVVLIPETPRKSNENLNQHKVLLTPLHTPEQKREFLRSCDDINPFIAERLCNTNLQSRSDLIYFHNLLHQAEI